MGPRRAAKCLSQRSSICPRPSCCASGEKRSEGWSEGARERGSEGARERGREKCKRGAVWLWEVRGKEGAGGGERRNVPPPPS